MAALAGNRVAQVACTHTETTVLARCCLQTLDIWQEPPLRRHKLVQRVDNDTGQALAAVAGVVENL